MATATTIYIRNREDRDKRIKDAIFAFSGGKKSLVIKGEGQEISTAVEVAEILKQRMYPGIEIANIILGSRPLYDRRQQDSRNRGKGYQNKKKYYDNKKNKNSKGLISNIEILLRTKQL